MESARELSLERVKPGVRVDHSSRRDFSGVFLAVMPLKSLDVNSRDTAIGMMGQAYTIQL